MPPLEQQGQPQPEVPVEQNQQPIVGQAKRSKAPLFIILGIVLLVAIAAAVAYFMTQQKPGQKSAAVATAEYYVPSIIDKAQKADEWQNGSYVVEGGHGLPVAKGVFARTANGTFTTTDENQKAVADAAAKMAAMPPVAAARIDEVAQRVTLTPGVNYQLDMLGLLNQVGYGLDDNLVNYFNNLLAKAGGTVADDAEALACSTERLEYRKKANAYLKTLAPNYVFDEKYKSLQWRIDTAELFNKLSIKANAPECYAYLDEYMTSNVENDRLAGTQLIFQYDDTTKPGAASIKVFVAPALPSDKYEKIFGVELTNRNATANVPVPPSDQAKFASLFNRQSAFTIATSQCGGLPVIALSAAGVKNAYITPEQANIYRGPQLRDFGYFCTPAEAEADGYESIVGI